MAVLGFGAILLCCLLIEISAETREGTCAIQNRVPYTQTIFEGSNFAQLAFSSSNQDLFLLLDNKVYHSPDGKKWDSQDKLKEVFKVFCGSQDYCFFISQAGLWSAHSKNFTYYKNDLPPIQNLHLSPKDPAVLLATTLEASTATQTLFLSTDFGANWTLVSDLPERARVYWTSHNPPRIYVNVFADEKKVAHNTVIIWTDDNFVTRHTLSPTNVVNWFPREPNKIIAITCHDTQFCTDKKMLISRDSGKTFSNSSFPGISKITQEEPSYFLFELSDDALWTYVERYCPDRTPTSNDVCWGDMFHSNGVDQNFSLSLRYQRGNEFTKFESIEGVYLSNQYVPKPDKTPVPSDPVRTLITYNKGSIWDLIEAPLKDSHGQPTKCNSSEGCSLHLQGGPQDKSIDRFYSLNNALGIMVANGNLGSHLLAPTESANFYYSRSGGMVWKEVALGRHTYEIGNHGGLVAAAKIAQPTTELIFTVDDGDTWDDCKFGADINVMSLVVAPGHAQKQIILIGTVKNGEKTSFTTVFLNFDKAFTGQCNQTDYENWSPTVDNGQCFMGSLTTFQRRQAGKACSLPLDWKTTKTSSQPCTCKTTDYECDQCFSRVSLSGECTLECVAGDLPEPPPKFCGAHTKEKPLFYPTNRGYRKVNNNLCIENTTKPQGLVPCELWKQEQDAKNWWKSFFGTDILIPALVVISVLVFLIIGVSWYCLLQNPQLRASICGDCCASEKEKKKKHTDHGDYGLIDAHGQSVDEDEPENSLLDGLESMDDTDLDLDV